MRELADADAHVYVRFHTLLSPLIPGVGDQIDHINGNGLDNRIINLRRVTQSVNKRNQVDAYKNSRTGVKGLHLVGKHYKISWTADNGKTEWLGGFTVAMYETLDLARAAAIEKLKEIRSGIRKYQDAFSNSAPADEDSPPAP